MRKNTARKALALALALVLIVSIFPPGAAMATNTAEDSAQIAITTESAQITAFSTAWNLLQTALDDVGIAEITLPLTGPVTPYTFTVPSGRTLSLVGSDPNTTAQNVAFIFQGNNHITITDLNIQSTHNHPASGFSPLHFAGTNNTLVLTGTNTISSGQTSSSPGYGAAVGVPATADLTIQGSGSLTVQGGWSGADIGGGWGGSGGTITISGQAQVTALGGTNAAGIGGGYSGAGGTISINDQAQVTATGGNNAAAIGGGNSGAGGMITISCNATVTATGGNWGAGIGGGAGGNGGTISISDQAQVTATGGTNAAGIGGGSSGGNGGTITINGQTQVTATGGFNSATDSAGAGIGGGAFANAAAPGNSGDISIGANAIVFANRAPGGAPERNSIGAGVNVANSGGVGSITLPPNSNVTVNGRASIPLLEVASQPAPYTFMALGSHNLNVSIDRLVTGTVSYQWFTAIDSTGAGAVAISGATSATHTVTAANSPPLGTTYYFVRATLNTGTTPNHTEYVDSTVVPVTISTIYALSLNPSGTHTFPAAMFAYGAQTPLTVTVSNTGNQPTGALEVVLGGTNPAAFAVTDTAIANIAPGNSVTFSVVPVQGLNPGSYAATVTVRPITANSNPINAQSLGVHFLVNLEPRPPSFPQQPNPPSFPFIDVPEPHWARDYVEFVWEHGFMEGISDILFAPGTTLNRAMLVTILWRETGSPSASGGSFSDVAPGRWYSTAIAWGLQNGIVQGVGGGSFAPERAVTREEMAAIFYRYTAHISGNANVPPEHNLDGFQDAAQISTWAMDYMVWANYHELIRGTTATAISSRGNATRAESAAMLQRFVQTFR